LRYGCRMPLDIVGDRANRLALAALAQLAERRTRNA
jgi:hypothetical protein